MAQPSTQDVNTAIKYNARQRAIDDAKFIMQHSKYEGQATPEALTKMAAEIESYYLDEVKVTGQNILRPVN